MSCRTIEDLLSEALDGELSESASTEVALHLEACADCRRVLAELRAIREAAALLPREIEPGRNLWPRVAARIKSPSLPAEPVRRGWRSPGRAWLAAAALIVLTVLAGLWARSRQMAPAEGSGTAVFAEMDLQADRERALASLRNQAPHLSPETLKVVEDNLRQIDEAIADIEGALEEEPHDPRIQLLLAQQHRRRAEVLGALEKTAAYL